MKQMIDSPRMEGLAFQQEVLPQLPPGFRFHPTDEELLVHYLKKKVSSSPFPGSIIAEIDLYKYDPWDLPAKACFGEQEWYFFSPRDRKYPNGARPNRSAGSGYWKATGTDKPIVVLSGTTSSQKVGVKKSLVFYKGRPLKGLKTNWIMHEYRLAETTPTKRKGSLRLDDWVLCRIYKKLSHSPTLASCPDLEAPSPLATDMERSQPKSAMPKFGSFSKLLQSGDPFMESFLSHTTSDANAALSHVEPSSTHQVVPRQLNSSETRSYASMTMGFSGDEVSSVYPAKRQNTMNPPSSLQLQSSNQYMAGAGAVPDQHMYQLPLNENWNPEPPAWPLPTGNVWSSFDNG